MIPVLSPSFFTSEPCCAELRKFLAHEQAAGRRDLILPIYFVAIRDLERQKRANELVRELSERQWEDWRPHANLAGDDPRLRVAIGQLAEKVADRLADALQAEAPPPLTLPGTVFRDLDAPWCPELVVIPPGRFRMGSPPEEPERADAEGPQHEVWIEHAFA